MKKLYLVLFLSAAASAWAGDSPTAALSQTNNPTPATGAGQTNAIPQTDQKSMAQIELYARQTPLRVGGPAPNEIVHGRLEVDGIFVQLTKTDNLAQLINPAAPERYGTAEENLVKDPVSGKASGLKFFELQF